MALVGQGASLGYKGSLKEALNDGQVGSARQPRSRDGVTLASEPAGSSAQATCSLEGGTASPKPTDFPGTCGHSRTTGVPSPA